MCQSDPALLAAGLSRAARSTAPRLRHRPPQEQVLPAHVLQAVQQAADGLGTGPEDRQLPRRVRAGTANYPAALRRL